MGKFSLYFGTRMDQTEASLHQFWFDSDIGKLVKGDSIDGVTAPTFVIRHPQLPLLYAVEETVETAGSKEGAVVTIPLSRDGQRFILTNDHFSKSLSGGTCPCHLTIDREGTTLFVSNYLNGVLTVIPLDKTGNLKQTSQCFKFTGAGPDPERQECSHIHSSMLSPDQKYLFVADLGLDRIVRFTCRRVADQGHILLGEEVFTVVPQRSGPRHMRFSRDGGFLYVVEELSNEISVFSYQPSSGDLHLIQTVSTLPASIPNVVHTAAEIHISPDDSFVYCSNRGYDSLVCYQRDHVSGKLTDPCQFSTFGKHPRNFALDATGTWILVANADSDLIVVFSIDILSGRVSQPIDRVDVRQPVCICWS
jgi:6-phosphogluconolactonase